ncbi:hypothetical protein SNE40_011622 [Patella caerulea]|uniref:Uncharacterized protein n=1 Tax=Patella caerulea TaxID=87958 RepID=A0AAN8JQB5_PATCE
MSQSENSIDENMSDGDHAVSDAESDNFSGHGDDSELLIKADKLDPADRALYEKLKQQEREEREEIELELQAHEEALARHQEELRVREKELRLAQERMQQRNGIQTDCNIKQANDFRSNLRSHEHPHPLLGHLSPRDLTSDIRPLRIDLQANHSPYAGQTSPGDRFSRSSHLHPLSLLPSPDSGSDGRNHHWTFEEQFKQLYELSEDPKRREFLDDLFSFMQKRGTPVNRIPIMAKQTLDIYELFRLVVSKGGLVEVINKKLWREITKGLNLPSSITSAAFTLRTQYMKYLYPYECEKLKLSSPSELQAAIDGNRREGRRSHYGYEMSHSPNLVPPSHLNGGLLNGKHRMGSPPNDDSLPSTPHNLSTRVLTERDALAMEAASRAVEEASRKMEAASRTAIDEPSPSKRMLSEEERMLLHAGFPSAHFKITSRNDGRSEIDSSLVITMEINGIMYQGVLFAQHHHRRS